MFKRCVIGEEKIARNNNKLIYMISSGKNSETFEILKEYSKEKGAS